MGPCRAQKYGLEPPGRRALTACSSRRSSMTSFGNSTANALVKRWACSAPRDVYIPSLRTYRGLLDLTYSFHDRDILFTACGRIRLHRKKINPSTVLAGQTLGISRSTTASRWSALWTTISAVSTWSKRPCHPSTTRSAEVVTHVIGTFRHPCLRALCPSS
jgi:hypothetical protein